MSSSSSFLSSHIVKKYWMAATGLFLCLFLVGHLLGNLQLFNNSYEGQLQFNEYAVFMTTNPLVKVLSYLTYFSILFHAIDGLLITIQNRKARQVRYAYSKAGKSSLWSSRNMGILGTIILVYIVVHMQNFWYQYKFGTMAYMFDPNGAPLTKAGEAVEGGVIQNGDVLVDGELVGPAMKDLFTMVMDCFQNPILVVFYVIGMIAMGFHLVHGFQSAFQSWGVNHPKYSPIIKKAGFAFAIVVSGAFAVIPIYVLITQA